MNKGFIMKAPDHFVDDLPRTLELHRTLAPKLERCVTPIAATSAGKTWLLGTGTFFRAADSYFLVTAAHVVQSTKENSVLLSTINGKSESGTAECLDVRLAKWTAWISQGVADIAIVPLADDIVAALTNRMFLRLDE